MTTTFKENDTTLSKVFIIMRFLLDSVKYDRRIILITLITLFNDNVLQIAAYHYYFNATKGDIDSIKYYTVFNILNIFISSFVINIYMKQVTSNIINGFTKHEVIKYSKLTFTSRTTRSANLFWTKLRDIESIFLNGYDLYILTTIRIATNLYIGLSAFWNQGLIIQFIGLSVVWLFLHKYICKIIDKKHTKIRSRLYNINSYIRAKLNINLLPFQYREREPEYIYGLSTLSWNNHNTIIRTHYIDSGIGNMMTVLLNTIIYIMGSSNAADFLIISVVSNKFTCIIHSLRDFYTNTSEMITEYDAYTTFWNGSKFMDDMPKMELVPQLQVEWVDIYNGTYKVYLPATEPCFRIGQGTRILVQGPTGGGKTTLVDGIIGKLDGVQFNIGLPGNYYHTVSDMFQNIRSMISTDISIRDYFKEEPQDAIIMECLALTFEPSELLNITNALTAKLIDPENKWLYDFYSSQNPDRQLTGLDVQLDNILSGGQKSRLCLASRCYELIRFGKQILVMDEPEQGCDPETAVRVLNRIFDRFPEVAIICVSHMCKCQIEALTVKWTNKIYVEGGRVTVNPGN